MKRLLLVIIAVFSVCSAYAQYAGSEVVDIKGSRVFLDGEKLSKDTASMVFADMNGTDRSQDYLNYRKGYKAGLGMSIGGASVALAGGVTLVGAAVSAMVMGIPLSLSGKDMPKGVDIALGAGSVAVIAGTAVMIAGIPTVCVYKTRLNRLEAEYNSRNVEIAFGPQTSGLGLSLRF